MGLFDKVYAIRPFKVMIDALVGKRALKDGRDMRRAAVLLKGHAWYQGAEVGQQPTKDDVVKFFSTVEDMSDTKQRSFVAEGITAQVIKMFRDLERYGGELTQHTSSSGTSRSHPGSGESCVTPLAETYGFTLNVKDSTVEGAGRGVFVECPQGALVAPGTVLGFFPGTVHLREHLKTAEAVDKLFPDDDFMLMSRADGAIIDGRDTVGTPHNAYALGHIVNHPPQGGEPNVLQASYDFLQDPLGFDEFPRELRAHIPNKLHKPATLLGSPDRSSYMHTIVLLAAKPLSTGEELFLDYRLNPDSKEALPAWYAHYDEEGARERLEA
jgi:hypothetical protein